MCHRVTPLLFDELEYALHELDSTGRARMPRRDPGTSAADAYPGTQLPLIIPGEQGFEPVQLTWGFETQQEGRPRLVFNTRIETALSQARTGRGLWAGPITRGRCLIPVRAFYESWTQEPPRKGAQLRFLVPAPTRPSHPSTAACRSCWRQVSQAYGWAPISPALRTGRESSSLSKRHSPLGLHSLVKRL